MGFEITFSYFEKKDTEEDFNRDEGNLKFRTVPIGSPDELIPMEKVAATIIKEYTKQNIWVEDVEVREWVKKSIKCSQTKTGVRIGSKSYNLGLNEIMKWAVDSPPNPQAQLNQSGSINDRQSLNVPIVSSTTPNSPSCQLPNTKSTPLNESEQLTQNEAKNWTHGNVQQNGVQQPPNELTRNNPPQTPPRNVEGGMSLSSKTSPAGLQYAQKVEVCDPPPELQHDVPRFRLTLGKKYKILEEKMVQNQNAQGGMDVMYILQNDEGREVMVSCHYFRQPQNILEEQSFYDPATGMLQTTSRYVDQASTPQRNDYQPKLLYENSRSGLSYGGQPQNPGNQQIDDVMARMDAAVRRRGIK
jgi:hypothetical protein